LGELEQEQLESVQELKGMLPCEQEQLEYVKEHRLSGAGLQVCERGLQEVRSVMEQPGPGKEC